MQKFILTTIFPPIKTFAGKVLNRLRRYALPIYIALAVIAIPLIVREAVWIAGKADNRKLEHLSTEALAEVEKELLREINTTQWKLKRKTPRSYYLVINSTLNEFELYRGGELIKNDKCSTGSYILLKNGVDQEWLFKTPRGEFRIQGKTTAPVWKKPDWAFVEEGLKVPEANHHSRFEYGVLGDYALSLGQGYLIHGTLYQRFIGLPVTHGCVRMNDENLELVYNSLQVGSKVFVY